MDATIQTNQEDGLRGHRNKASGRLTVKGPMKGRWRIAVYVKGTGGEGEEDIAIIIRKLEGGEKQ